MFDLKENTMRKLFTPHTYIRSFDTLSVRDLKQRDIRLLLCDIDNTLVAHDIPLPDERVLRFVKEVQEAGIVVVFISNNVKERVQIFAKDLSVSCYPFAMKPLPITFRKVLKDYNINRKYVAMLGDQLLTDMLGANLMGLYTILTAPVAQKDLRYTKMNRKIENMIFWYLGKRGKLKKGEFHDKTM